MIIMIMIYYLDKLLKREHTLSRSVCRSYSDSDLHLHIQKDIFPTMHVIKTESIIVDRRLVSEYDIFNESFALFSLETKQACKTNP